MLYAFDGTCNNDCHVKTAGCFLHLKKKSVSSSPRQIPVHRMYNISVVGNMKINGHKHCSTSLSQCSASALQLYNDNNIITGYYMLPTFPLQQLDINGRWSTYEYSSFVALSCDTVRPRHRHKRCVCLSVRLSHAGIESKLITVRLCGLTIGSLRNVVFLHQLLYHTSQGNPLARASNDTGVGKRRKRILSTNKSLYLGNGIVAMENQVALLSQRGRAMLRVCQ